MEGVVVFAGKVFQQTVGIPMGTICAHLLAEIFFCSYEGEFIESLLSMGGYIVHNDPEFDKFLGQMYPAGL